MNFIFYLLKIKILNQIYKLINENLFSIDLKIINKKQSKINF